MKTANVITFHVSNQRGTVALGIAAFGISMALIFGSFLAYFNSQYKIQAKVRMAEEVANLQTAIKMTFSTPEACSQNLNSGAFGNSLSRLRDLSDQKKIRINYPTVSGGTRRPMVVPNGNYNQLKIGGVQFAEIETVPNLPQLTYRAKLQVTLKEGEADFARPVEVPFYFTVNGGNLVSCYATSYAPTATGAPAIGAARITMEDALCQQLEPGSVYLPNKRSCVPRSSVIAAN